MNTKILTEIAKDSWATALGAALATLLLAGCIEENPAGGDGTGARRISATVDGTAWSDVAPTATRVMPVAAMTIVGLRSASSEALYLKLNGTGTGTFDLGSGGNSAQFIRNGVEFNSASGGSGRMTVTSYNETTRTISGTFSFVAKSASGSSVTIRDGSFTNVRWNEQ